MLDERRATSVAYDRSTNTLRVTFERSGPVEVSPGARRAGFLVDARGFLVGVDLVRNGSRVVVMLGGHEHVERVVDGDVTVVPALSRQGEVELHIGEAHTRVRGGDANPYFR
ncbi:MAG: hypothetical protein WCI05_08155 [Myxococcales bacterium]|jgi:hypothetical protein